MPELAPKTKFIYAGSDLGVHCRAHLSLLPLEEGKRLSILWVSGGNAQEQVWKAGTYLLKQLVLHHLMEKKSQPHA